MVKQPLLTIEPTGNISLLLGNIEYQEYSYEQSRPSGSAMRHVWDQQTLCGISVLKRYPSLGRSSFRVNTTPLLSRTTTLTTPTSRASEIHHPFF
ncbi:hypothetical protein OUZ56_029236 [Daphnia magna]|uniref:Uncharacterized protein n=1 Tax=Daphnia magna TaxID=35525 RepID=A0ABR0B677_9CRUS|nr:hypothetical protein OUZ56_029236 [Daphnia magna]